jgi:signal transduction histidine kinase
MDEGVQKNKDIQASVVSLIEALCHKIRTPLSVISNDLVFYEPILGADEIQRSKRKIEEIKIILKECSEIVNLKVENSSLGQIADIVGAELSKMELNSIQIKNGSSIALALSYLWRIISDLACSRPLISSCENPSQIQALFSIKTRVEQRSCNLELFNNLNLTNSPHAALSNLLLCGSGGSIIGTPNGELTDIQIIFLRA